MENQQVHGLVALSNQTLPGLTLPDSRTPLASNGTPCY